MATLALELVSWTFNSLALMTILALFLAEMFEAISPAYVLLFISSSSKSDSLVIRNLLKPFGSKNLAVRQ
jgi:hypothetical protein